MMVAMDDATPHQEEEEATPLDMRNLRLTPQGTYAVRVTHHSAQKHVGTYKTHADAIAARDRYMCEQDARFRARDTPIAKKPCQPTLQLLAPVSEALPLEAPSTTPEAPNPDAKVKGVYERQTNDGTVYDVIAYCQGVYCWGGRYRTHKAAVEARTKLSLTSSQVAAVAGVANVTGERGISVRFNKGRGLARNEITPVYTARIYQKGAKNLGSFSTLEAARAAIASARAKATS